MSTKDGDGSVMPELAELLKVMILRQEETRDALMGLANNTATGFEATNHRLDTLAKSTAAGSEATNDRLDTLAKSTAAGFDALGKDVRASNDRLDKLIEISGVKYREHEERIGQLEATVKSLATRRTRGQAARR